MSDTVWRAVSLAAGIWLSTFAAACEERGARASAADLERGRAKFRMFCSPCHGPEGQGTPDGPPPLSKSPWVMGPETRLIRILLHGVRGAIEVHGKTYNLEMPGFGLVLTDADIAAILSFVRDEYGGPSPPVARETVGEVRALHPDRMEYWTVEELLRDG